EILVRRQIEDAAAPRLKIVVVGPRLAVRGLQDHRAPVEHERIRAERLVAPIRAAAEIGGLRADVEANAPRVIAEREPLVATKVLAPAVDLHPARDGSSLVIANDVGDDTQAVGISLAVAVLEERGHRPL